jgi:hypothetical protein
VHVGSTQGPKEGKAGNYSIYIIFPRNPGKDEGGMRVYAGQAISEDEAIEWACAILDELSYPWQGTQATEQVTREASPEQDIETGDRAAIAQDEAVRHPLNTWVRTSGRSRTRGRVARSRGRSSRR